MCIWGYILKLLSFIPTKVISTLITIRASLGMANSFLGANTKKQTNNKESIYSI